MKTPPQPTPAARPVAGPRLRVARATAILVVLTMPAAALPLHTYTFDDVTTGSGRASAGAGTASVSFSAFTAATTLSTNSNTAGVFAFGQWVPGGATNGSNVFTGAIDLTEYYEFTVTPQPGYAVSLTSLAFSAGRTGTGPRQFVVRSDADAFGANLAAVAGGSVVVAGANVFQFPDNAATSLVAGQQVALAGPDFTGLGGARTFRLYAFNAEGAGQFRLDDLTVHGTAVALPEAMSTAWALVAAVAAGRVCRRRGR